MSLEIGFIGLGAMGFPIAANLAAAGFPLTAWNRTPSKALALAGKGVRIAERPEDTARAGGVVISMVADDAALESLELGDTAIVRRIAPGGIHLSMSTVAPATIRRLAEVYSEAGSTLVAAPVFGRPDAAAAKKLWVCVSGAADAKQKVRPILDAIGQAVFDFGVAPEAACVAKISGNFLLAAAMEAMGEAFAMAEKSGLERGAVAAMLTQTIFACPAYQGYGKAIAERRHSPAGFRLPLGLKDIELVLATAREVGAPMPAASLVRDRLVHALAMGRGELDWSALAMGARDDAGLKD
ncbi:MAG TPA: NAD(P)-dependent oxidoreductase [Candidatus Binataceae bacterium]|nr:NAD(P)-dependent oxidoreductase [Candidatus Binataceae bacterium]